MLRTLYLQEIIEQLQENVFDFDYEWKDVVVNGKTITKNVLQDAFTEYWWYYQIGYSTLDEFKWRLKRNWKTTISVLQQRLSLYPTDINLHERTLTKQYENNTDNKYSDTPNQPMLDTDPNGKYLTDRTNIDMVGNSTECETKNTLAKYSELDSKLKDLIAEYVRSFKYLFITDVIIYEGILKGGL